MTRWRRSLRLLFLAWTPFGAARLALYLAYRSDFAAYGPLDILWAAVQGLRFDLSILLVFLAPPLLMMNLPAPAALTGERWCRAWAWLAFAATAALASLLAADVVYYGLVRRHIVGELSQLGRDYDFLPAAAASYGHAPLLLALALAPLFWLWRRSLRAPTERGQRPWLALALLTLGCFLGLRGSFSTKALNSIDAYGRHDFVFGNLILNGAYTALHAAVSRGARAANPLTLSEALETLGLGNRRYPLLRAQADARPTGLNIIIVLLESWDLRHLGRVVDGRPVTPVFDRLCDQSLCYEQFYACSQRSIGGIQAVLTGVPVVAGLPELRQGLEHTRLSGIGTLAARHGYRSLFVQTSKRRSYYLDAVAGMLGFADYFGQEDIPLRRDYAESASQWGWDDDMFQFALARLRGPTAPFLAFLFTGTTHEPYPDPGPEFRLRPHEPRGDGGLVNAFHYTDGSLGRFIEGARREPWFERTIWIIGADHAARSTSRDVRADFRIPLLIYAPGRIAPGRDASVRSQVDILPTLIDLLGFPDDYAAAGTSLLQPGSGHAYATKGDVMAVITADAFLTHSIGARLDAWAPEPSPAGLFDSLERRLLATHRLTHDLIRANRWAP